MKKSYSYAALAVVIILFSFRLGSRIMLRNAEKRAMELYTPKSGGLYGNSSPHHESVDDILAEYGNECESEDEEPMEEDCYEQREENFSKEGWDAKNSRYIDSQYHFHWALHPEYEWKVLQSDQSHTVFKAETSDGINVYVNINSYDGGSYVPDVWDDFDYYEDYITNKLKRFQEQTGGEVAMLSLEKVKFAVPRALREVTRFGAQSVAYYSITYMFFYDDATWQVVLNCPSDVYKKLGTAKLTSFFSGFGINAVSVDN